MTWDQAVTLFIIPMVVALLLFLSAILLSLRVSYGERGEERHDTPKQRSPAALAGD